MFYMENRNAPLVADVNRSGVVTVPCRLNTNQSELLENSQSENADRYDLEIRTRYTRIRAF